MNVAGFIRTVFNFTSFTFANSFCNVHRDSTNLRVRHETFRTEDFTETTNFTHHVRSSDCYVEFEPATFDLFYEIISTDIVSASN